MFKVEELSRTIFTIIPDDLVERILAVTEQIVGDLNEPGNGILVVLPADSVHGLIEYGNPASSPNESWGRFDYRNWEVRHLSDGKRSATLNQFQRILHGVPRR